MTAIREYSLSPLKPYNESIWEQFSYYDELPYVWNSDSEKHLRLVSGNMIKGYRCQIKGSYEIKH